MTDSTIAPTNIDTDEVPAETTTIDRIALLERIEHPNEMLTMAEVAAYLQLPVLTLRKWREKNKGPRARHAGRHLRYRARDVTERVTSLD
ncbi:helix-turn-helix domain-containing protein [uncultured Microbacterium sp.]|uniref:helix-turn-helix domain-containing protein n=1 Tax=uncultured Microbacterium sp. TaxID=191216 RepID=UPI0035CBFF89